MCRFALTCWLASMSTLLVCSPLLAEVLPTSTSKLTEKSCRLDIFHLFKNEQNNVESNLQLAMITDNLHRQRYIALKTSLSHPSGFENIGYYRSGQPIEIFTANWRKVANKYSVSRIALLGGTSDRQAFDVFTRLVGQDQGHFELKASGKHYRFNANRQDLNAFFDCVEKYYQY